MTKSASQLWDMVKKSAASAKSWAAARTGSIHIDPTTPTGKITILAGLLVVLIVIAIITKLAGHRTRKKAERRVLADLSESNGQMGMEVREVVPEYYQEEPSILSRAVAVPVAPMQMQQPIQMQQPTQMQPIRMQQPTQTQQPMEMRPATQPEDGK